MIRLVVLLLVGIFIALSVLGEDHGQQRAGLRGAAEAPVLAATATPGARPVPADPAPQPVIEARNPTEAKVVEAKVVEAAAMTRADLRQPAAPPLPAPEPEAEPAAALAGEPALAPQILPQLIVTQGANLRSGPGRTNAVVGGLAQGDLVQILPDDDPGLGWRHVRRADGTEGYVAARLVAPAP